MLRPWFDAGGPLMWPLLICSILLAAILVERTWSVVIRHLLMGWRLPGDRLNVHRRVLPFFAEVPPALGLLGTVLGVVQSFRLLDGQIDADAIGGGLAVACTTTIFGVSIAVIAAVAGHVLDWLTPQKASPTPGMTT
ncbi:MAG: MotA/TolQ/ExbB proton channel family protein [Phycisphaerales bacterium]|nr:MotA/TolQ/ExbB proton channel family protein [Phycisphaerales bacterium]